MQAYMQELKKHGFLIIITFFFLKIFMKLQKAYNINNIKQKLIVSFDTTKNIQF